MGVGEPGSQDAFVAGADQALGVFVEVDDREETGCEFAVAFLQRKIFLMVAHHGDQDFVRQAEESRVEGAFDYRRVFVQVGDETQERSVFVEAIATSFNGGG